MFDAEWAREFAAAWIAAWNAQDIERILSHCTHDFQMQSPLLVERMGASSGMLIGKEAVRPYWQKGLGAQPPLHFALQDTLVGIDTIAIYYLRTTRKKMVAEVLRFNDQGRIASSAAWYGQGTRE
jgi:SnoaL-like domain